MMPSAERTPAAGASPSISWIIASLILLLSLFPPETRGGSMVVCAALVLALGVVGGLSGAARHRGLLLAAAAGILAVAVSDSPGAGIGLLAHGFLAAGAGMAAASWSSTARRGPVVPWAVGIAGASVALQGLAQRFGGLERLAAIVAAQPAVADRAEILTRLNEGRAFANFPTPAALAGYLALALPVTVAAAVAAGRRSRIALLAIAIVQAGGLVAAASASAVAALIVAWVLAIVVRRPPRRLSLAALAGAFLLLAAVAGLRDRRLIDPSEPGSPWRLRWGNARAAVEIALDAPWVGVGPGTFGEALAPRLREGDNETRYAHVLPLHLAAENGIVLGATGSLVFFLVFLFPVVRLRGRTGAHWHDGAAVGLAAFALQNLADFTAFLPSVAWSACILRGVVAPDHGPRRGGRHADALGVATVGVAAIIASLGGLAWNARVAARQEMAASRQDAADAHTRRAVRLVPWDAAAHEARAAVLAEGASARPSAAADLAEALSEADVAVAQGPRRASARVVRARIRARLGDVPGAWTDLVAAAAMRPLRDDLARERDGLAKRLPAPDADASGP